MKEEISFVLRNVIWKLTDAPNSVKPIKCKWIFMRKRNSEGKVERYKAKLVAKGFTQQFGFDYHETLFPTARIQSIQTILALIAYYDYELFQMDVNTFFNRNLDKDIYTEQPFGFIEKGNENIVYKLEKSIYSLKQVSRQ